MMVSIKSKLVRPPGGQLPFSGLVDFFGLSERRGWLRVLKKTKMKSHKSKVYLFCLPSSPSSVFSLLVTLPWVVSFRGDFVRDPWWWLWVWAWTGPWGCPAVWAAGGWVEPCEGFSPPALSLSLWASALEVQDMNPDRYKPLSSRTIINTPSLPHFPFLLFLEGKTHCFCNKLQVPCVPLQIQIQIF